MKIPFGDDNQNGNGNGNNNGSGSGSGNDNDNDNDNGKYRDPSSTLLRMTSAWGWEEQATAGQLCLG
jgi:hypothetical protein